MNTALAAISNNKLSAAVSGMAFLAVAYEEGQLGTLLKVGAPIAAWWLFAEFLKRLIETLFIPEAELAELAASMTAWFGQMGFATKDVISACNR